MHALICPVESEWLHYDKNFLIVNIWIQSFPLWSISINIETFWRLLYNTLFINIYFVYFMPFIHEVFSWVENLCCLKLPNRVHICLA